VGQNTKDILLHREIW